MEEKDVNVEEPERESVAYDRPSEEDIEEVLEEMHEVEEGEVEEALREIRTRINGDGIREAVGTSNHYHGIRSLNNPENNTIEVDGESLEFAAEEFFGIGRYVSDLPDMADVQWMVVTEDGGFREEDWNPNGEHLNDRNQDIKAYRLVVDGEPLNPEEVKAFATTLRIRERMEDTLYDDMDESDSGGEETERMKDLGILDEEGNLTLLGMLTQNTDRTNPNRGDLTISNPYSAVTRNVIDSMEGDPSEYTASIRREMLNYMEELEENGSARVPFPLVDLLNPLLDHNGRLDISYSFNSSSFLDREAPETTVVENRSNLWSDQDLADFTLKYWDGADSSAELANTLLEEGAGEYVLEDVRDRDIVSDLLDIDLDDDGRIISQGEPSSSDIRSNTDEELYEKIGLIKNRSPIQLDYDLEVGSIETEIIEEGRSDYYTEVGDLVIGGENTSSESRRIMDRSLSEEEAPDIEAEAVEERVRAMFISESYDPDLRMYDPLADMDRLHTLEIGKEDIELHDDGTFTGTAKVDIEEEDDSDSTDDSSSPVYGEGDSDDLNDDILGYRSSDQYSSDQYIGEEEYTNDEGLFEQQKCLKIEFEGRIQDLAVKDNRSDLELNASYPESEIPVEAKDKEKIGEIRRAMDPFHTEDKPYREISIEG